MFERYTEKARRVIFFARQEASEIGGATIEPHHILLGLLRENRPLISRFCGPSLPPLDDIRDRVRANTEPGDKLPASVDMSLSRQAMQVLTYAADESQRLNDRYVGTEHLLIGLLRVQQGTAAEILAEQGVDLNHVRDGLKDRADRRPDIGEGGSIEELRRLAIEARDLAEAMVEKAERIEAICEQLAESTSDQEGDNS